MKSGQEETTDEKPSGLEVNVESQHSKERERPKRKNRGECRKREKRGERRRREKNRGKRRRHERGR